MMSSRPMMMTYASPPYMPVTMTTTTTTTAAAAGNTPNATAQLLQPPPAGQPSMMQSPSLPAWSAQPTCMWPGQQQQKQQQQQVMNACSPGPIPMMTMMNISTNNNNNTNNNGNSVPIMVLTPSPANTNLAATTNTANTSYAPVSNTSSNSTIHNVGAMSPASPMTMSMTGVEKGNTSATTTTTRTMMMQNNNTSPYAPRMTCAETPYILTSLPAPVAEANNTNNTNNSTNAAMTMNGAVSAFAPSQQQQQPMPASMTTSPYNMPGGYTITTAATIPAQASNNNTNTNTNNGSYMMSNTAAAAAAGTTGGLCMMSAEGANGPTTTAAAAAIPTGAAPTMTAAQIPAAATMMMMPVPTTQPTYAPLVTEAAAAPTAAPAAAPTPTNGAAVVQPQMMATFVQPTVLLPSTAFDGAVFLQPLPTAQPLSLIAPPPPPPLPQLALPVMREEHQWNGTQYELNGLYEGYVKRYNPVRGFGFLTATHRLLPKTVLHIPHLSQDASENSSNNNNSSTTSNSNSTGVASSSMTSSVLSAPACHAMMGEGLQPHDAMTNQPNELQQQQQQQSMYAASLSCESMLSGSSTNAQGNMQLSSVHFHRIPVILGDIFVHQSYLMMRGFRSLPLSGRVRFRVGPMPGRCTLQAVEVELLPQVVPADVKRSLMLQHMHVLLQQQQATGTTATATTMESSSHGGQMSLPGITTAAAAMNAGHAARCGTDEDELCTTQTTTSTTNGTDSQPLVTASLTGLSVAAEHSPRGTLTLPFSERQLLDSGFYDPILDENDPLTTENFVFTMDDMVLGESATQPPEEEGMQHREGNKHGGSSFSVSLLDFDNQEEKEGVRGETRAHEATASHKSRYTAYQQVVHH